MCFLIKTSNSAGFSFSNGAKTAGVIIAADETKDKNL